jgi:hypothetical protein
MYSLRGLVMTNNLGSLSVIPPVQRRIKLVQAAHYIVFLFLGLIAFSACLS